MTFLVSVRKLPLAGSLRNTRRGFISSLYVLYSLRLPSVRTDLYFSRTSLASFTFNGYALPFSCTKLSHRTPPVPLRRLRYPPRTSQRNVLLYLLLTSPCSHRSYLISSSSLTPILRIVTPPDTLLLCYPLPIHSLRNPFEIPIQTLSEHWPTRTHTQPFIYLTFVSFLPLEIALIAPHLVDLYPVRLICLARLDLAHRTCTPPTV